MNKAAAVRTFPSRSSSRNAARRCKRGCFATSTNMSKSELSQPHLATCFTTGSTSVSTCSRVAVLGGGMVDLRGQLHTHRNHGQVLQHLPHVALHERACRLVVEALDGQEHQRFVHQRCESGQPSRTISTQVQHTRQRRNSLIVGQRESLQHMEQLGECSHLWDRDAQTHIKRTRTENHNHDHPVTCATYLHGK